MHSFLASNLFSAATPQCLLYSIPQTGIFEKGMGGYSGVEQWSTGEQWGCGGLVISDMLRGVGKGEQELILLLSKQQYAKQITNWKILNKIVVI